MRPSIRESDDAYNRSDKTAGIGSHLRARRHIVTSETETVLAATDARRLHIGGETPKEGWQILNVLPNEHTDFVGDVTDLTMFADESWHEVYGSHILEHLDYSKQLPHVLREIHRILTPNGVLKISVPDLETLAKLFVRPELNFQARYHVMRMIMGGQTNPYDYHKVGLTFEFLQVFLGNAGFRRAKRVHSHGLFKDTSDFAPYGVPISLNVEAYK